MGRAKMFKVPKVFKVFKVLLKKNHMGFFRVVGAIRHILIAVCWSTVSTGRRNLKVRDPGRLETQLEMIFDCFD